MLTVANADMDALEKKLEEASEEASERAIEEHLDQMLDGDTARHQRAKQTAREWLALNPLFLDTETTGLGYDAEIVSLALLDTQGNVLLDTLVKPTQPIPPEVSAIHRITDSLVENAPTFGEVWKTVRELICDHTLIIYNADFDSRMIDQSLEHTGIQLEWGHLPASVLCAMELYAEFYGDWNDYHGNYRWQKLVNAARQCNLRVQREQLHGARADAEVCRQIVMYMASDAS